MLRRETLSARLLFACILLHRCSQRQAHHANLLSHICSCACCAAPRLTVGMLADYANSLIVGNTFRPIMDSLLVSREKLAYITDATSAPVASISPISSWIGALLATCTWTWLPVSPTTCARVCTCVLRICTPGRTSVHRNMKLHLRVHASHNASAVLQSLLGLAHGQRAKTSWELHANCDPCAGFELSLIDESYTTIGTDKLAQQGWETSPFLVFLKTIPGRFYPIAMLFLQVQAQGRAL